MAAETHELHFEDFTLRVDIEADGKLFVSFHESGKCVFTCDYEDLREILDFTAVYGLKMRAPYIVEMDDAEKAGIA